MRRWLRLVQTEWTDLSKWVEGTCYKMVLSPFQMLPGYPLQPPSSPFLGDLRRKTKLLLSLWLSLVVGLSHGSVCKEGGIKTDSGGAKCEKTLWLDDSCPDMAKEKSDTPLNLTTFVSEILIRNHHSFPAAGKKALGKCFLLVYLQVYHLFCLFVYCFVLCRLFLKVSLKDWV